MSRIDDLIAKLCPDGVEYKRLGDIGNFTRGSGIQKKDFVENGKPCIHYGQIYTFYGLCADKTKSFISDELFKTRKKATHGDLVIATTSENDEDVCKCVAWLGDEPCAVSGDAYIYKHTADPKYMAYLFSSELFQSQKKRFITGTKVLRVSSDAMEKFEVPVPPMEIQQEIVKVLDSFIKLEAELEAELEARRAQYRYYRDQLLSFERERVQWLRLADCCSQICSGATPNKKNPAYYQDATVPWLRTQEVRYAGITDISGRITELALKETAAKLIPKNCVIVAISGASAGRCAINKIECATNQHCLNLEINPAIALYKYVYHCVCNQTEELLSRKEGARGDLNAGKVKSMKIPVPSLDTQRQIVDILDRFDDLTTSLTDGLPAEIEARRQQYAYYRDRLLALPRKSS